jgi:hypothetical protein
MTIPTVYDKFPERKAEFLCRAARVREAKNAAALVDFTDEIAAIDALLAKLGKPAEPATIGEARDVAYGVSELHLDWLDEQATRGCEPYRKVSTEYDDGLPF